MKLVMYAHGGSKNHGCEAIVRTTAKLLTEIDSRPILLSYKRKKTKPMGYTNLLRSDRNCMRLIRSHRILCWHICDKSCFMIITEWMR